MRITAYATGVNPNVLLNVKQYILAACRFDYASWPSSSYQCMIWKDGQSFKVSAGAFWTFQGNTVYVDNNPEANVPTWAPVALKCIAELYGLTEDSEVMSAIQEMIDAMRQKMVDNAGRATAGSMRGRPVRQVALHTSELQELAYYNVAEKGEPDKMEWRDHAGNTHEIDEEDSSWIIMEL